jgi:hypothetical protein
MLSESDEEFELVRRPRVYRPRQEYLNAEDFRQRFRLMPWQAELLINIIGPHIETRSRTPTAMSARHKLMAALRFYASNGFYYFDGDAQGQLYFTNMTNIRTFRLWKGCSRESNKVRYFCYLPSCLSSNCSMAGDNRREPTNRI